MMVGVVRQALAAVDTRQEFSSLWSLYLTIALVVAGLVLGTMAYALVRYRRREGSLPREPRGLKPLEGVWIAVVAGIVVVLLVSTFRTEDRVDAVPGDPPQTIHVVAFQWGWRFEYPGTGVSITGNDQRPPAIAVPAGEPVRFELVSRDVIHAFWVPDERFKRDAFPNRVTTFDLEFQPGVTATGRCAEFCGLAHDRMDFEVAAMAPDDFRAWLKNRERRARGGS